MLKLITGSICKNNIVRTSANIFVLACGWRRAANGFLYQCFEIYVSNEEEEVVTIRLDREEIDQLVSRLESFLCGVDETIEALGGAEEAMGEKDSV
jgi:hypothetical protein